MGSDRRAVVVTHSRLRESGTVVPEAVDQLRHAGFRVTIVDNVAAPRFGGDSPRVDPDTEETRSYFPNYKMNQLVEQWVAEADVKVEDERFDAIDPKDFSEKLTAVQDEYIAQAQAQASASPSVDPSAQVSAQPETSDTPAESPVPTTES